MKYKAKFVLCTLLLVSSAVQAQHPKTAGAGKVLVPGTVVLTNNAETGELGYNSGVTYTAEPAFDNPADATNSRLLDRDKPVANWNVDAGLNKPAQALTFELKRPYAVESLALHLPSEHKPATVAVSLAIEATGSWRSAGVLKLEEQTQPWWRLK